MPRLNRLEKRALVRLASPHHVHPHAIHARDLQAERVRRVARPALYSRIYDRLVSRVLTRVSSVNVR
jgi:hypothetical protein